MSKKHEKSPSEDDEKKPYMQFRFCAKFPTCRPDCECGYWWGPKHEKAGTRPYWETAVSRSKSPA